MGDVVKVDFTEQWVEIAIFDCADSTMSVYRHNVSGAVQFVQVNDYGESITTELHASQATSLSSVLRSPAISE